MLDKFAERRQFCADHRCARGETLDQDVGNPEVVLVVGGQHDGRGAVVGGNDLLLREIAEQTYPVADVQVGDEPLENRSVLSLA